VVEELRSEQQASQIPVASFINFRLGVGLFFMGHPEFKPLKGSVACIYQGGRLCYWHIPFVSEKGSDDSSCSHIRGWTNVNMEYNKLT